MFVDHADLPALALDLRDVGLTTWTETDLRSITGRHGWVWDVGPDGDTVVRTGFQTAGPARPRAVGTEERRYASGDAAYVELAVPIGPADLASDATAQATAYAEAAATISDALGPAPIVGSYGDLGPYYGYTPQWGAPYLRWRSQHQSIELRAGQAGPELVLTQTDAIEHWFWVQGQHGDQRSIPGYFGFRSCPATGGLSFPGGWLAEDWTTLEFALRDELVAFPAESLALDMDLAPTLYANTESGGQAAFDVFATRGHLYIAAALDTVDDPRALGWVTAPEAPATQAVWYDFPQWRIDGGGIGEVDGARLASILVATARAAGVPSPDDITVSREGFHDLWMRFYGLGLRTR